MYVGIYILSFLLSRCMHSSIQHTLAAVCGDARATRRVPAARHPRLRRRALTSEIWHATFRWQGQQQREKERFIYISRLVRRTCEPREGKCPREVLGVRAPATFLFWAYEGYVSPDASVRERERKVCTRGTWVDDAEVGGPVGEAGEILDLRPLGRPRGSR